MAGDRDSCEGYGYKPHEVPSHPSLEVHLNGWIRATETGAEKKKALFLSVHKGDDLTGNAMSRFEIFQMIKRRSDGPGLPYSTCCHTCPVTGILDRRSKTSCVPTALRRITERGSART